MQQHLQFVGEVFSDDDGFVLDKAAAMMEVRWCFLNSSLASRTLLTQHLIFLADIYGVDSVLLHLSQAVQVAAVG